jgi:tripartite-type tricarboxylate transporter receptor subunit TctC
MTSVFSLSCKRVLAAAVLFGISLTVHGQTDPYPSKPIRIVIGNAAGAVSDTFTRLIGAQLAAKWGQPVVVEAKPGASGAIAAAMVAKAPPDGYTLGMVISTHSTNPYLQKDLSYDAQKSFAPITMLGRVPTVLSVHPSAGIKDLADLIAKAKVDASKFAFGSAGTGGMTHMAGELLNATAGIRLLHVPYKGGAAALNDLRGGQIPMQFSTVGLITPHHREGRIRSIAVASKARVSALPDVPTFAELGYPDVVVEEWYALLAPAGTPEPIIAKLSREINEILKGREIKEKMIGMNVEGSTPAEAAAFIASEMARWSKIIATNNIRME